MTISLFDAHSSALPTELILPRFKLQVELRKKVRAIPRGKESCPGNTVEGKEIEFELAGISSYTMLYRIEESEE